MKVNEVAMHSERRGPWAGGTADLSNATYNDSTIWPVGYAVESSGAVLVGEREPSHWLFQPLPKYRQFPALP